MCDGHLTGRFFHGKLSETSESERRSDKVAVGPRVALGGYLLPARHHAPNFHLQDLCGSSSTVSRSSRAAAPPTPILQGRPGF